MRCCRWGGDTHLAGAFIKLPASCATWSAASAGGEVAVRRVGGGGFVAFLARTAVVGCTYGTVWHGAVTKARLMPVGHKPPCMCVCMYAAMHVSMRGRDGDRARRVRGSS